MGDPVEGTNWGRPKPQNKRDKLLKEDEYILSFVNTFVASGIADGQETSSM